MTLRELFNSVNLPKVYEHINTKDNSYEGKEPVKIETTINSYSKVVKELTSNKKAKPYKYSILVDRIEDWYDKSLYFEVSLLNKRYVPPPVGLKPWGGGRGKSVPEGYYNCNNTKYNKKFAFGSVKWSEIIDTPIINNTDLSNDQLLGEILWELTFYGWTEAKIKKTWDTIGKRVKEAKREVKEGKYIELLPKKEGGTKIIIPESLIEKLEDIEGPIDFQNL